MNKRIHIFISGRVQGVFFRFNTKRKAKELGVVGWVKNLGNGRVEIVAEGEEEKLKELLRFCKKGPTRAEVSGVETKWEKSNGEFKKFKIKHWLTKIL